MLSNPVTWESWGLTPFWSQTHVAPRGPTVFAAFVSAPEVSPQSGVRDKAQALASATTDSDWR